MNLDWELKSLKYIIENNGGCGDLDCGPENCPYNAICISTGSAVAIPERKERRLIWAKQRLAQLEMVEDI